MTPEEKRRRRNKLARLRAAEYRKDPVKLQKARQRSRDANARRRIIDPEFKKRQNEASKRLNRQRSLFGAAYFLLREEEKKVRRRLKRQRQESKIYYEKNKDKPEYKAMKQKYYRKSMRQKTDLELASAIKALMVLNNSY